MKYGMAMVLTPEMCVEMGDEMKSELALSLARMAHSAFIRKLRDDDKLGYCKDEGARLEIYLKDLTNKDKRSLT